MVKKIYTVCCVTQLQIGSVGENNEHRDGTRNCFITQPEVDYFSIKAQPQGFYFLMVQLVRFVEQ